MNWTTPSTFISAPTIISAGEVRTVAPVTVWGGDLTNSMVAGIQPVSNPVNTLWGGDLTNKNTLVNQAQSAAVGNNQANNNLSPMINTAPGLNTNYLRQTNQQGVPAFDQSRYGAIDRYMTQTPEVAGYNNQQALASALWMQPTTQTEIPGAGTYQSQSLGQYYGNGNLGGNLQYQNVNAGMQTREQYDPRVAMQYQGFAPTANQQYYTPGQQMQYETFTAGNYSQYYQPESNIQNQQFQASNQEGRYNAVGAAPTTQDQFAAGISTAGAAGGEYLANMYRNPNVVNMPTNQQGQSYYDLAKSNIENQIEGQRRETIQNIQGDLAARGITGGAAAQIIAQANAQIDAQKTQQINALEAQKLQTAQEQGAAREQALISPAASMMMAQGQQSLQERLGNMNASLQNTGLSLQQQQTVLDDIRKAEGMTLEDKQKMVDQRLQEYGLNTASRQQILGDLRQSEQMTLTAGANTMDARLQAMGLDQQNRQAIMSDIRQSDQMAMQYATSVMDKRLQEIGLDQQNRQMIINDIRNGNEAGANQQLQAAGLDQQNRQMIINDLRNAETAANADKWASVDRQLQQQGINNDTRAQIISSMQFYDNLNNTQTLQSWNNQNSQVLNQMSTMGDIQRLGYQQSLSDYGNYQNAITTSAYNLGQTSPQMSLEQISQVTANMSPTELAAFNSGRSQVDLQSFQQWQQNEIDRVKGYLTSLDPADPNFVNNLNTAFNQLNAGLRSATGWTSGEASKRQVQAITTQTPEPTIQTIRAFPNQ